MPTPPGQTTYSETWMLFESGSGVTVDLSLHEPPQGNVRPIDAYVVTECEGDFTGSARRAAEAVYEVARQSLRHPEAVVVGYDLHGLPSGMPVAGASGGLAFAIALAKRIFKNDPGPVAATGEVKSGHEGGPIGAIKGIEAKLKVAGTLLPEQAWVFYPKENDGEISDALRRSLTQKGMKLRPVSSVAEALEELFDLHKSGSHGTTKSRSIWRPLVTGVLIFLLIGGAAGSTLWFSGWNPFVSATSSEKERTSPVLDLPETAPHNVKIIALPIIGKKVPQHWEEKPHSPQVTIDMKGETRFASDLAQLLSEVLTGDIKKNRGLESQTMRLSGRVVILQIDENPMTDKSESDVSMTVTVSDLKTDTDQGTRSFSAPRVSVKGKGLPKALLPRVASDLSRIIIRTLKNDSGEKRKETFGNAGFE